jgi:hypothetical protein
MKNKKADNMSNAQTTQQTGHFIVPDSAVGFNAP